VVVGWVGSYISTAALAVLAAAGADEAAAGPACTGLPYLQATTAARSVSKSPPTTARPQRSGPRALMRIGR
jgi:hypothetical protein